MTPKSSTLAALAIAVCAVSNIGATQTTDGFTPLFNGRDFTGWKLPAGDNGHWRIVNGVIDYDAESEAKDKDLWTERTYRDFTLRVDWRLTSTPYVNPGVPIIRFDGSHKKDAAGREIRIAVPDSDSGIFLRGSSKAQVNIWGWPIGSGEVYGYRTDAKMPAEVRAGVTPRRNADRDIGEWNSFEITMRGSRLDVVLNGEPVIVNATLPGVPAEGPIALQHHGAKKDGLWVSPPSLVQFRNISIKELPLIQQPAPAVEMTPAEQTFHQTMSDVVLEGFFTVGDGTELHPDRYVIESVTKVKDGVWRFAARVQYNKKDFPVTINVPVFFAGDTPVMSLTRQGIQGTPGLFDTRLVIYKGGYAGTWGAGATGGKMFGNIVKNAPK